LAACQRKRLRFLRFSFAQRTQRKRLRLNGNRALVCLYRPSEWLDETPCHCRLRLKCRIATKQLLSTLSACVGRTFGTLCLSVCLFVCLFVRSITQKLMISVFRLSIGNDPGIF